MSLVIRHLSGNDEILQCVALQEETWGSGFSECVPPTILLVTQKMGGVVAGAFEGDRLVGFVFGMTGIRHGKLAHWSDMLAVKRGLRDAGLGQKLKLFQYEHCRDLGVETIYWTYDPLVARNAHLNLNRLGARVEEYVEEMYAILSSPLHMGLGLDRFIVTWPTQDSRIASSLRKGAAVFNPGPVSAPIVNTRLRPGRTSEPATLSLPSEEVVRIEIPEDIQTAKKETPDRGSEWRECTRRAFQYYLGSGYSISSFYRDPEDHRCFYVLTLST